MTPKVDNGGPMVYIPMMSSRSDRQGIKIPRQAYEELKELASEAARHGWSAFGIDRDDPPTQTALLEEAIRLLKSRRQEVKRRRKR